MTDLPGVISGLACIVAAVLAPPAPAAEPEAWPMPDWARADPADVGMDAALLEKARDYALTGEGSGCITRHGRLVLAWGDPKARYDLKSTTKSIGVTALGLALADGKVRLDDPATKYHPSLGNPPEENLKTGWIEKITLFHLATQTAGFDKPGGCTSLLFEPGTQWSYSDGGPNWLAECLTLLYRRDLADLLFERVFTPLGIARTDLVWRKNSYRPADIEGLPRREFGAGASAGVDAMARLGLLYLREGRWQERRILPAAFVAAARATPDAVRGRPVVRPETYPEASNHYGLLWWNNADAALPNVPRDAYWSWGLYDSLIVVLPGLDVVVARAGKSWKGPAGSGYAKLAPFLDPIVASVRLANAPAPPAAGRALGPPAAPPAPAGAPGPAAGRGAAGPAAAPGGPPYPPSPIIRGLAWAPRESIVRRAPGGDNWPITWADDDHLYTAYGDGRGFEPHVETKLSLGLARVEGPPGAFTGVNLRAPTLEQRGDGPAGRKASGLLALGGTLYLWARNAGNAQLAWSADRGRTWTWAPWKMTTSFGCPTFLQSGRGGAGARDEYVYVYSFDSDGAYRPADRMVLARAPRDRLRDREAYEFFVRLGPGGRPEWTRDVAGRGAVFEHPGRCYRGGVSWCAGLGRYLWWQVLPGADPRFAGGFGVYDAPEPWGPWTTAFFTEAWDAGPGESGTFPTKWMSADGRTLHLVFSGDDAFSVRRATVDLAPAPVR